jgi:hypothetical protein
MIKVCKRRERIAIMMVLFVFLLPCFNQMVELTPSRESTTISTPECSFDFSTFRTDNEEKENEEFSSISDAVPLLDLSNHILKLQAIHQSEYSILSHDLQTTILQPLGIICVLLI